MELREKMNFRAPPKKSDVSKSKVLMLRLGAEVLDNTLVNEKGRGFPFLILFRVPHQRVPKHCGFYYYVSYFIHIATSSQSASNLSKNLQMIISMPICLGYTYPVVKH